MATESKRGFVDLTDFVDATPLANLDREITYGLAQVQTSRTGGSHRSMGIMPAHHAPAALGDYGEILARMSDGDFALFLSLASTDVRSLPQACTRAAWGEDRALPLSDAQFRFLEYQGAYFPWSVYIELMPGGTWSEKSDPRGKAFTREALTFFPRTVAWIRRLPLATIGSVKLLGLSPLHHGTVHRDGDPHPNREPDAFITFCPRGDKRLFVWDDVAKQQVFAPSKIYWFDDHEYHGVAADPFFRYSIRVDGQFDPSINDAVRARLLDARREAV